MALPLPRLDDRTFDELVSEAFAFLPRLAPRWTDYNASDPGITLIELFAWLAETGFYRLDRIPPASTRAFLRLVGIEPRSVRAARTVVVADGAALVVPVTVTPGLRVASADQGNVFQTTQTTSIVAARLVAVLSVSDGSRYQDYTAENTVLGSGFAPFGPAPSVDSALYLGFDEALQATPAPLGLYLSTGFDATDAATRECLRVDAERAHAEAIKDQIATASDPIHEAWCDHYAARIVWEYYAAPGLWAPLAHVADQTRALTLSGFVRFVVPTTTAHQAGGVDQAGSATRFFIRARLAQGVYDCPPRIRAIFSNAFDVRHAVDSGDRVLLGVSNGRAGQVFSLGAAAIVPGSTRLEVEVNGVPDRPWREALQWDRVGPHDRSYVLSPERSEIAFGDGRIGWVPAAGAKLWATFAVGGGVAGNVPAGTLTALEQPAGSAVRVTQPFVALGGDAAEELDAAIGRALRAQAIATRVVTLNDCEELVLGMPGVPIARAFALADYHPQLADLPALGCITVVVVPRCASQAARLDPSPDLLRAVACYLEPRRPLTTEVHVVGPCYSRVAVDATLHVASGADPNALRSLAESSLNRFLDPIRGGPEGAGWPFGRAVYRAEVMALLNDLPGVDYVDEIVLRKGDEAGTRCSEVQLCRHGLVVPGAHRITLHARSYRR